MVAVDPAIQQHLAKRRQIASRCEQSGVPGDAANGKRVFVVHGALHELLAISRVIFRGSDAAEEGFPRIERRAAHVERREDLFVRELIHGFSRGAFENFAEQYETKIGVNRFRPRRVFERFLANRSDEFALGMEREEIVFVRGEPRRVRQQIADRDFFTPIGIRAVIPFGKVASHGQVEPDAGGLHLHGDECCRHDRFGERCDIVNRVHVDGR